MTAKLFNDTGQIAAGAAAGVAVGAAAAFAASRRKKKLSGETDKETSS